MCRAGMVNLLTGLSVVTLYAETILTIYTATELKQRVDILIVYIVILVTAHIVANMSSALMIKSSMDFSGKYLAKVVCFAVHFCQQSIAWRFVKLVMVYDKKDWSELTSLRLVYVAIQSLPFLALQSYITCSATDIKPVYVLAITLVMLSCSVSLTMFCVHEQLHVGSWTDKHIASSGRKYCGVLLMCLGTTFSLATRFASIVLMCLVVTYFVFIPIGLHMACLIFGYMSCKAVKSESLALHDVLLRIGLSYLNIFDLVERDIQRVECKYVLYYTIILVENIVMVAIWLLKSELDYTTKLIVMVVILALFICALVLKFVSCGLLATPANVELIESSCPDQAAIKEGNRIIESASSLPSLSSQTSQNDPAIRPSRSAHEEGAEIDQPVPSSPTLKASPPAACVHHHAVNDIISASPAYTDPGRSHTDSGSPKDCLKVAPGGVMSIYTVGNGSVMNYETHRSETQDSYSLDDPVWGGVRYDSRDISIGKHNKRVRNRSSISLDICSSNSRNTNTVATSPLDTSETSGVVVDKANFANPAVGGMTSVFRKTPWRKVNLKWPTFPNLLLRTDKNKSQHQSTTFQDQGRTNRTDFQWVDNDTSTSTSDSHTEVVHNSQDKSQTSLSVTNMTGSTAACTGSRNPNVVDPRMTANKHLTREARVKLWLTNIHTPDVWHASCPYSSESHSSDCTYVLPPKAKVVTRKCLAEKHHSIERNETPTQPSKIKTKLFRTNLDEEVDGHNEPKLNDSLQTDSYLSELILSPYSKYKESDLSGAGSLEQSSVFRPRPKPSGLRRSASETCSESTAMFELRPILLAGNGCDAEGHTSSQSLPFVVKLGAMESLV